MPRIPDADVARLKQMVPLTDLAAAAGVTLVGQGHNPTPFPLALTHCLTLPSTLIF